MIRRRFDDHRHVGLAFWQRLLERRCFLVRIQFYKKRKVRRIKNIFFKKEFLVLTRITFDIDKIERCLWRERVVELFGNFGYKAGECSHSVVVG